MIVLKTLEPEEVLRTIIYAIADVLPPEILDTPNAKISASFNEDKSIEVCLIFNNEESDNKN